MVKRSFCQQQRQGWASWAKRLAIASGGIVLAIAPLPGKAVPGPTPHLAFAPGGAALAPKQASSEAPPVPALPSPLPVPISPQESGILPLPAGPSAAVGLGHLRPADLTALSGSSQGNSAPLGTAWLRGVALPIYPSPDSPHWGWLMNGWLVPNDGPPLAVGRDAAFSMVQTERRLNTFPVLELRPDGWFRFQYTQAGTAWAHTSHLDLGPVALTVEPWEAYLENALRVEFQRPGVAQPMRRAPRNNAPLQALVGPNSLIQPLAMEGDWLRVRVTQPAQGCTPLPGARTSEGWVRWRSDATAPLVWFPAGGC